MNLVVKPYKNGDNGEYMPLYKIKYINITWGHDIIINITKKPSNNARLQ